MNNSDVQVGGSCQLCGGTGGDHTPMCDQMRRKRQEDQQGALKAIVKALVDQHLVESGLVGVLERCQAVVTATDRAFELIESDPHHFGVRVGTHVDLCQTCQTISVLIGRDFGCVKRRKTG